VLFMLFMLFNSRAGVFRVGENRSDGP
jgi:hypothetical protein